MGNLKSFTRWLATHPALFLLGSKVCSCGPAPRVEQKSKKMVSRVRQRAEEKPTRAPEGRLGGVPAVHV